MARGLDHLVLATRDLPRLATRFTALGFQVGARNRHPWGTENHIIQFRSSFLELIGLGDEYRPLAASDPAYPFAGFLERYLATQTSGIAMAVLHSDDAAADAADFARSGLGSGRTLPFSRSARGPDGRDRTVAFTLAFAEGARLPSAGFFTSQQHRPENFWNAVLKQHANGAVDLSGFTLIADEPADSVAFLSAFAGHVSGEPSREGCEIAIERGRIRVMTPAQFETFAPGRPVVPGAHARIGAMHLVVQSLAKIEAKLAGTNAGWIAATNTAGDSLAVWLPEEPTFMIVCTESEPA